MESIKTIKLENAIKDFFPQTGRWTSSCFDKPKDYLVANLPCHLRDNKWLAVMLQKQENLNWINIDEIYEFICASEVFKDLRHAYELRIVNWQINYMLNNGENWLVDENYGGDFYMFYPTCDLAFRKGIVDTLAAIGMDYEVIEEGIEKNAEMWRDRYMQMAFYNQFNPQSSAIPEDKDYLNKWMQLRKYQYYEQHKDAVDKYGNITPEMQLSDKALTELKIYLAQKSAEINAQTHSFNQLAYKL